MSVLEQAADWAATDPDPATREELLALLQRAREGESDAVAELSDAFAGTLQFGTAGLRGKLGPGPNRMNRVVVGRAATGLAQYLLDTGHAGQPVVIGYDARHNSDVFARDTAEIMGGAGLRALVLPRPLPTPVLAASILRYNACAGVMVTASHNPPQDNGYKVYLGDGRQIVPPDDEQIAARIAAAGQAPRGGFGVLGEEVVAAYLDRVVGLVGPGPRDLRIAYTALHGVGSPLLRAALVGAGFPEPLAVAEQDQPDPEFPTVAFPNPEEPGAMDLALQLAASSAVDLVIANDPDADRCAVAIPDAGGFRMLTGDEVGCLLGWWLLRRGVSGSFACSLVSSELLGAMAGAAGVPFHRTLTGFKWITRAPDLAYGYEEALGYCVDPAGVRDKDGISAALLVAEMAAALKAQGRSLQDVLDDLAREHGVHATRQVSLRFADLARIPALMASLRAEPPRVLGGLPVLELVDLSLGSAALPPTDGLLFRLDGARVIIRPSGTEPKVKAYLEVREAVAGDVAAARARAADRLADLAGDVGRALT